MLFLTFPDSISSFKLIVMVSAGVEADGVAAESRDFSEEEPGAGKSGGSVDAVLEEAEDGLAAEVSDFVWGLPESALADLGTEGSLGEGSESSNVISGTGRVTMTWAPASLARPPASARTSRSVTWLSAW